MRINIGGYDKTDYIYIWDINLESGIIAYYIELVKNDNKFEEVLLNNLKRILSTKIQLIDIKHNLCVVNDVYLSLNNLCTGEKIVFVSTLMDYLKLHLCIGPIIFQLDYESLSRYKEVFKDADLDIVLFDSSNINNCIITGGMEEYVKYYNR